MRSSRARSGGSFRLGDQRGLGLVEYWWQAAFLGVSLAVMLGNLSTMVGARVADRRTGEERLVRNQIEALMAAPPTCSPSLLPSSQVDGTSYTVTIKVTARDS